MKPEWHIEGKDGCYESSVKEAKNKGKYIRASISKEDIGKLLQGKHVTLLFLNDEYREEGMLDIEFSEGNTTFEVSDELNNMIIK